MDYISTRGQAPKLGFCDAVLAGLASDGGLYVPATWPTLSPAEISALAGKSYSEIAYAIISRFVDGEIPDADLKRMIDESYATFAHASVAPLVEIEPNHFVLELWHGPTLAFKDVAMQFLARVMDYALGKRGTRATIVGATSGDTGSAAIEAFRGRDNTDIIILHPLGRTSDIQRRQMTTVLDANVHNIALEGTFDDCQSIVKGLFNHHSFRDEMQLSGVNSINWGRIVAQVVYYFTSAISLGAPTREVTFVVPTGNFGDIFAGYVAKNLGLPVKRLVVATNDNNILQRAIDTGRHDKLGVVATTSPSMDIEISSNFERLLFNALDRDAAATTALLNSLSQSGGFEIPVAALHNIRAEFDAGMANEAEVEATIAQVYQASKYLIDPHTAVAVAVARQHLPATTPVITLSTAHPSKFPTTVQDATGVYPNLPHRLADLDIREERFTILPNDQSSVEAFIRSHSRVLEG